jgi:hypothetical protein
MQDVPYGYCQCGCGRRTKLADRTAKREGWTKGEPIRFIHGHHKGRYKAERWIVEDRGYDSPCWIWQLHCWPNGYGAGRLPGGRRVGAHREVYERLVGPVPEGLQLDHLCRIRCCVNPDHLEPVTQGENLRRGYASRRAQGS